MANSTSNIVSRKTAISAANATGGPMQSSNTSYRGLTAECSLETMRFSSSHSKTNVVLNLLVSSEDYNYSTSMITNFSLELGDLVEYYKNPNKTIVSKRVTPS